MTRKKWDEMIVKNIYRHTKEKELLNLKTHLINYETVSIVYDTHSYDDVFSVINECLWWQDTYYVIDWTEWIENFSQTKITDTFDCVKEPCESDFFECVNKPYLIVKWCENIHPYMIDVLDCSLLKWMLKYKFYWVDENWENIDGRTEKKRIMWNRKCIFLCELEPFLVKNDWIDSRLPLDTLTHREYELVFGWGLNEILSWDEDMFWWDILNSDNSKSFDDIWKNWKWNNDWKWWDHKRSFRYDIEQERYEMYKDISHIQHIYAYDFFFASSIYGSIAPYILYIDNQYMSKNDVSKNGDGGDVDNKIDKVEENKINVDSKSIKDVDSKKNNSVLVEWYKKRDPEIWMIEPLFLHIKKQKSYHNRKIILFASKHRNTHYLQFLYNIAKKKSDWYYGEPEYIIVRTKIEDFRFKNLVNKRWENVKRLTIFTKGLEDFVSESENEEIANEKKSESEIKSKVKSEIKDKKTSKSKKLNKSKKDKEIDDILIDKRIEKVSEFSLRKCRDVRLMNF